MISSNIELGSLLLDCAYNSNVSFFINVGTYWQHYHGEAYNPVNLYAATKQALEDIANYYRIISDMKICTFCLNDTYGKGDTRKKYLLNGKNLPQTLNKQWQCLQGNKSLVFYIFMMSF